MQAINRIISLICCIALSISFSFNVYADGDDEIQTIAKAEEYQCTAKSCALIEANTGTLLYSSDENEKQYISHLTKLMTILLCAEKIESGELTEDKVVTVSPHANSMQGTQIWLEVGEKITVEELLYAVTVGNANDAAAALAETVSGTEESFVTKMNLKAQQLNMKNTEFADASGISHGNISTAYDIALLGAELSKYDFLTKYFTTWMLNVRYGKTELVNTNRLVRSYNGIMGLKTAASDESGECIAVSAKRGEMCVVGVFLQSSSADDRFSDAKQMLDSSFSSYEMFSPEVSAEYLNDIKIENGQKLSVGVRATESAVMVVPRGNSSKITVSCLREETIIAPFEKGLKIGSVEYYLDEKLLTSVELVTDDSCKRVNYLFSLKRMLYSLLNY